MPAALTAHLSWAVIGSVALEKSSFPSKSALLDHFLSIRINNYITDIILQPHSKLANVGCEVNKLNIFSLLFSSGLEYILEYFNESLTRKGFSKPHMNIAGS